MKLSSKAVGGSLKVATITLSPWYILEEGVERFKTVGLDGIPATFPESATTLIDFHDPVWVSFEEAQNEVVSK